MRMNRASAEFWWNLPVNEQYFSERGLTPPDRSKKFICPPNVAYYEKEHNLHWKPITWNQVMEERRKKQKLILDRIKGAVSYDYEFWKPVIIHVFDNSNFTFFSGTYIVISAFKKQDVYLNFGRYEIRDDLILKLMKLMPYCLPVIDFKYNWMKIFIEKNKIMKTKNKRPEGKKIILAKYKGARIVDFKVKHNAN